jgi:hypothetical protein
MSNITVNSKDIYVTYGMLHLPGMKKLLKSSGWHSRFPQ